jgi:hypothetical protein
VRDDVSDKSKEWGYSLGTVYVRKVHFRDASMIQQIEEKVVNRLRQVTSAIRQDGTNQVNLITSTAARQAAVEFAKAAAMRPFIVGERAQHHRAGPGGGRGHVRDSGEPADAGGQCERDADSARFARRRADPISHRQPGGSLLAATRPGVSMSLGVFTSEVFSIESVVAVTASGVTTREAS